MAPSPGSSVASSSGTAPSSGQAQPTAPEPSNSPAGAFAHTTPSTLPTTPSVLGDPNTLLSLLVQAQVRQLSAVAEPEDLSRTRFSPEKKPMGDEFHDFLSNLVMLG